MIKLNYLICRLQLTEFRLGGGGSSISSGSSIIENGYTINFYDCDKTTLLESHSAKCGNYINAPVSITCEHWRNIENDNSNNFPLTADTEGIFNLYSSNISYVDSIYSKFGIDKEEYPYMVIVINQTSKYFNIYFGKTLVTNNTDHVEIRTTKYTIGDMYSEFPFDMTVSSLCSYILTNFNTYSMSSTSSGYFNKSGSISYTYFANFVLNLGNDTTPTYFID